MKKFLLTSFLYLSFLSAAPFHTPEGMLLYVKRFLPDNPVILEAGGHHGEDTNRMKTLWPQATMHVFEPLPSSYEKLVQNTRKLPNVFCYPYALSHTIGKTNFYFDFLNDGASSIGAPVDFNQHEFKKEPLEVQCTTLNEWSKNYAISRIDFMWLDMEGHELYMLLHASNVLDSVKAIYTEFSFVPIRSDTGLYIDLKRFLESKGFTEIHRMEYGRFGGDVLFMRL